MFRCFVVKQINTLLRSIEQQKLVTKKKQNNNKSIFFASLHSHLVQSAFRHHQISKRYTLAKSKSITIIVQ